MSDSYQKPLSPCYWRNGDLAPNYGACGNIANRDPSSTCCPYGWTCTSANICVLGNSTIRGACTDRTWSSALCPQFCFSQNSRGGAAKLKICATRNIGTDFCCAYNSGCQCSGSANEITVGPLSPMRVIPNPNASGSLTIASVTVLTTLTTTTGAATAPASKQHLHASSGGGSGLSAGAVAGVAIATAIIGILLAALVFFLLWRARSRKRQAQDDSGEAKPVNGSGGGANGTSGPAEAAAAAHKSELHSHNRAELDQARAAAELETPQWTELPEKRYSANPPYS